MQYDFTSILPRNGRDAIAVDGLGGMPGFTPGAPREGFDAIPMWVADMNFPTVPTIQKAMADRIQHPAFGYFSPSEEYFASIIRWQQKRNGVTGLAKENIGYENGVLGGVVSALNCVCSRGDKVLLHSPTYVGFTSCLTNNGYDMVLSPLVKDEDGIWRMDFEDMEKKLKEQKIHAAVLCNPHNPCGRVWERWELEKAMELFKKYDVYVVSDEIWSDLMLNGHKHIPTQSISEDARQRTAAMYAPSKTFNLAGLVGSYHIIYNKWWKDRVDKESSLCHYNSMNVLSMHALVGAYKPEGYQWVDQLCEVLSGNINFACDYIRDHFEGVEVSKPQGTYMLFVDCTKWCEAHGKTIDEVEKACWDVGVAVQDGRMFHGPCHLRMNLALPLSRVQEAFDRLAKYVFTDQPAPFPVPAHLAEGDQLPDFVCDTPFEKGIHLADKLKAAPKTALVLLRYYGCPLCQLDIHELAAHYNEITAAGGQLLVVLQSDPAKLAQQLQPGDLPFEILCDPDQKLYKALGVWPAPAMVKMGDEATMDKIRKAAAAGYTHGEFEGNELQLPAAFVADSQGRLLWAHYGVSAGDVPGADQLAKLLG